MVKLYSKNLNRTAVGFIQSLLKEKKPVINAVQKENNQNAIEIFKNSKFKVKSDIPSNEK